MDEYEYMKAMSEPGAIPRLASIPTLEEANVPIDIRRQVLNLHVELVAFCEEFHMTATQLCGPDIIGPPKEIGQPQNIQGGLQNALIMLKHTYSQLRTLRDVYYMGGTTPDRDSAILGNPAKSRLR